MAAKTISAIPSYNDYGKTLEVDLAPWQLPNAGPHGFTNLSFKFKQKGLYYIQVYLHNKAYDKGKVSTEGKICASGLVIEVK